MTEPPRSESDQPPRFLADENLEKAIVSGVRRRRPEITFMTAGESGTLRLDDLNVLRRARELDLILITHDRRTMPAYFGEFLMELSQGEHCPGVYLVTQERHSIGEIIDAIVLVYDLSSREKSRDQIRDLPL